MDALHRADQHLLVVGGYAAADQPGLHAFAFNTATGVLTEHGAFAGIFNPSFLVVHPNQRWLYAVSETSQSHDGVSGGVWALRFEAEGGAFSPLNQRPSGGDYPAHLSLDATGRWLLVANYGTGNVAVFPIGDDGVLGEMTDLAQHQGSGPNRTRQEGPHAHSTTFAPDNRFVIAADLGTDQLVVYEFDHAAGKLVDHGYTATRPGSGPRHCAFHPNGRFFYVANELDSTTSLYDYDPAGGTLHERQFLSTLPPDAPENTVADIHLAPDGRRLYVSNRGHNSIAVFDVAEDGQLTPVTIQPCGGSWPRNFALAPGGRFVLVANQYSDAVTILPLLNTTDAIGSPLGNVAAPQPSCIQFVGEQ